MQWRKAQPECRASQDIKLGFWLFYYFGNACTLPPDILTFRWSLFISNLQGGRSSQIWCLWSLSYVSISDVLNFFCNYLLMFPWFSALEVTNLVQPCTSIWNQFISLLLKPTFTLSWNLVNVHCSKLYLVYVLSQNFSYYILNLSTCNFPTRFWISLLCLSSNKQLSFIIFVFTLARSTCSGYEVKWKDSQIS